MMQRCITTATKEKHQDRPQRHTDQAHRRTPRAAAQPQSNRRPRQLAVNQGLRPRLCRGALLEPVRQAVYRVGNTSAMNLCVWRPETTGPPIAQSQRRELKDGCNFFGVEKAEAFEAIRRSGLGFHGSPTFVSVIAIYISTIRVY